MTSLTDIAQLLIAAHAGGPRPASARWALPSAADAYAVQDAILAAIGPIGGWKVGTGSPDAVPHCAPLPLRGMLASGVDFAAGRRPARLVELEVALRAGTDIQIVRDMPTPSELAQCFDAVLPAIEVVDSRLAEGRDATATARLADLQSHGALVMGGPSPMAPDALDLRTVRAALWFGDVCAARTTGGNPAPDVWRLVGWLGRHCTERGVPLRKGQVVTTGSCTGLLAARFDQPVRGEIAGIGAVGLHFGE